MFNIFQSISFDISKIDENAITIFIIGFSVVFAALISIYLFFYFLPKIFKFNKPKSADNKPKKANKKVDKQIVESGNQENKEVYAAIAMALHMHFQDMHDEESMVLTMDINQRLNTPWNSKIISIN